MIELEYLKRNKVISDFFTSDRDKITRSVPSNNHAIKKAAYKRLIKHYEQSANKEVSLRTKYLLI